MLKRGIISMIGLACMVDSHVLQAQDVFVQNEPQVILPIGIRSWEGTARELRQIDRIAVPASYRTRCESDERPYLVTGFGCQLDLFTWHFNFGTARSAEQALDYLSEHATRQSGLSSQLAERYVALLPDARREAESYLAAKGFTYDTFLEQDRRIEALQYPALAELHALQGQLQQIGEIASLYARAADWYRSPTLLRKAVLWREMLVTALDEAAAAPSSDAERLLKRVAGFNEPDFLELSLSVSRAAIERSAESILAANEASARAFDPAYRERDIRRANSEFKAKEFRYYRFRIQLLADELELDVTEHDGVYLGHYDFDDMESISRPEEREMDSIHYLAFSERQRFAEMIVAQGERDVRVTPAQCREDDYFERESLDILFNGGRFVSAAHSPAPYRRIAQLYLDLYEIAQSCPVGDDGSSIFDWSTQYDRQARIYRRFLDDYQSLARGR